MATLAKTLVKWGADTTPSMKSSLWYRIKGNKPYKYRGYLTSDNLTFEQLGGKLSIGGGGKGKKSNSKSSSPVASDSEDSDNSDVEEEVNKPLRKEVLEEKEVKQNEPKDEPKDDEKDEKGNEEDDGYDTDDMIKKMTDESITLEIERIEKMTSLSKIKNEKQQLQKEEIDLIAEQSKNQELKDKAEKYLEDWDKKHNEINTYKQELNNLEIQLDELEKKGDKNKKDYATKKEKLEEDIANKKNQLNKAEEEDHEMEKKFYGLYQSIKPNKLSHEEKEKLEKIAKIIKVLAKQENKIEYERALKDLPKFEEFKAYNAMTGADMNWKIIYGANAYGEVESSNKQIIIFDKKHKIPIYYYTSKDVYNESSDVPKVLKDQFKYLRARKNSPPDWKVNLDDDKFALILPYSSNIAYTQSYKSRNRFYDKLHSIERVAYAARERADKFPELFKKPKVSSSDKL